MSSEVGDPFGTLYRYVDTATSAPGNFSTDFLAGQTVNGVLLEIETRILIKNQADPVQNGIYMVQEASDPLRTDDMQPDSNAAGFYVFLRGGDLAGQLWECVGPNAVVGTDPLTWSRVDAVGTLATSRGGTGTSALGGTNTLLMTSAAGSPVTAVATAASAVLGTTAGGVPQMSATLPAGLTVPQPRLLAPQISDGATRNWTLQPAATLDASQVLLVPKTTSTQTLVLDTLSQQLANKQLTNASFVDASGTRIAIIDTSAMAPGTITLAAPSASGTLATQEYVQGIAAGVSYRQACRAKTTGIVAMVASGSGVGKTLTSLLPAGISSLLGNFDGTTVSVGDRILVDSALFGAPNASCGIYTLTNAGSIITSFVLTRATDADTSAELPTGTSVFITHGATAAGTTWTLTTTAPTIDVTPTLWTQSATSSSYGFAGGLVLTGNQVTVGTSPTIGSTAATLFVNSSSTSSQVLLSSGAIGTAASYGQLPLANANAVTGQLGIANGGTAQTSFTSNALHYGNFSQTNALASGVAVTNSSGVPNISRTLPGGLTFAQAPALAQGAFALQLAVSALSGNSTLQIPGGQYTDTIALTAAQQVLSNKSLVDPRLNGSLCDASGTPSLELLPAPSSARTLLSGTTIGASSGDLAVSSPLQVQSGIKFRSAADDVTLLAQTGTSSYSLQLPLADGGPNYVLGTNGSGVLSWVWRTPSSTVMLPMLHTPVEAATPAYTTIRVLTLPADDYQSATLTFTVGSVGAGADARLLSVRVLGTNSGTIYAEYTGVNAVGQYQIAFLVLPSSQDLLQFQVLKSAVGGANPSVVGATLKLTVGG